MGRVMARALSSCEVNASMGRICAAPTAGSCGIVPAVIISICEKLGLEEESALRGLITCSGIGAIIVKHATVAGAEGRCQPCGGSLCKKKCVTGCKCYYICHLALSGIKSNIPFDEVVEAMYKVGKMLPYQLRETAMGGIAATETAKGIAARIFGKQ